MNPADNTWSGPIGGGWDRVCGVDVNADTCMQYTGSGTWSGTRNVACFRMTNAAGSALASGTNVSLWINPPGTSFDFNGSGTVDSGPWMSACTPMGGTNYFAFLDGPTEAQMEGGEYRVGGNCVTAPSGCGDLAGTSPGIGATVGATYGSPFRIGAGSGAQIVCGSSATATTGTTTVEGTFLNLDQDYVPKYDPADTDHSNPIWSYTQNIVLSVPITSCPYLISVQVAIGYYDADNELTFVVFTWTSERWTIGVPYTDDDPVTDVCKNFPNWQGCGVDQFPEIVCEIEYTDPGNPITVLAEFFGGLGPWATCMVLPIGWDRQGLIEKVWNNGNVAELTRAYDAAVPNGIVCGSVMNFNFMGNNVSLNTCDADFAPSVVKTVFGWLIVLGVAVLCVRRIMWTVGSKG